MTISASETLIRYLGPSEAYFWLSNQNSWKHFVVAAQITGETTTASWRTALDAVQRRHPLLGVCIDKDDSGAPYMVRAMVEAAVRGTEERGGLVLENRDIRAMVAPARVVAAPFGGGHIHSAKLSD